MATCQHRDPKTDTVCTEKAVKNHFCAKHWWEACQRVAAWMRLRNAA
jgi:hypothetical protein